MTELVAALTSGQGTWTQVSKVIENAPWNKIILVTTAFGKEKYTPTENTTLIVIDNQKPLTELVTQLTQEFKKHISGLEVGLNLVSGDGKEHTAILAALMAAGVGFRLVAFTTEGLKEF